MNDRADIEAKMTDGLRLMGADTEADRRRTINFRLSAAIYIAFGVGGLIGWVYLIWRLL